jgi:hypothetical protein
MAEAFYTSGQAAKALDTSSHRSADSLNPVWLKLSSQLQNDGKSLLQRCKG